MTTLDPARLEALGPAEQIIHTLTRYTDHMVHNRPGLVRETPTTPTGVTWLPATTVDHDGTRVVYTLSKSKRKLQRLRAGVLGDDGLVRHNDQVVGRYQPPGLMPETAAWLYRQVARVFAMDNAFVAHWASWAFAQENRDLKVVLAAFLLVQPRCGEPVHDGDTVVFFDDDYRNIGEAMCLLRRKDGHDLNPKLLLRVGQVLEHSEVAAINRELGFGRSTRRPFLGRWPKAVVRWLRHREHNPKLMNGLIKAGFRRTVMRLAQKVGYKPTHERFFALLRWRQKQAEDGRRTIAIGKAIQAAESWNGLNEQEICERIVATRPHYKRLVGLLPTEPGLTRAIMTAAVESGCVSKADLIILTPTLEELGLLDVPAVGERWLKAMEEAENQRAANIATRVRSKAVAEKLQEASDAAVQRAVSEVVRGLRVYVFVDKSGSMEGAIDKAKSCLAKFLQGFPVDKTHVAVFNTRGREISIKHSSAAGVEQAFRGHKAGGGTDYGAGVQALSTYKPNADEDALFLFVGDQLASTFDKEVRRSGLDPVAFGMLHINAPGMSHQGQCVEETASLLGIPCFAIDEAIFDDPYAVTRTLKHLIASTPASASIQRRRPLIETILNTKLLQRPVWA